MSINLSNAEAAAIIAREDQGQVLAIRDEVNNPIVDEQKQPFTITIAGAHSSVYRRALSAHRDRANRRTQIPPSEVLDRQWVDFVAACVLAWSEMTFDDQPFPCSKENAFRLLTAYPWIRRQLEEAMHDHEGFIKASSRV